MNLEQFRSYCLKKKGVEESFPFDETALVFKVMGKMFAITDIEADQLSIGLKCDPERAQELRELYEDIVPGYHMNKKHWNTVHVSPRLSNKLVTELIDYSYDLVQKSLTKQQKETLSKL